MILEQHRKESATAGASSLRWILQGKFSPDGGSVSIPVTCSPFRLGRSPQNDLCIPSDIVSGQHAVVIETSGLLVLRDIGSTNGTYVNGKRITGDHVIAEGELVEIGDAVFRIVPKSPEPKIPTAPLLAGKTISYGAHQILSGPRSLQTLLRDGNLLPCFQAIHCLTSGLIRGYEFLARSSYPGVETAGQLFEQARLADREVELSLLCRRKAMEFSALIDTGIPVFMNTHPLEPILETVVPQLKSLREEYPDRPCVLEIHESAIAEPAMIRRVRQELAEFDVQLAFDDFGKGQSRIRELISAPCDFIKFDPSLISDLQQVSREQLGFFRSLIQGIKNEGAVTIAEGIETEEMASLCRDVGFDQVQGYLFSRPAILPSKR